MKGFNNHKLIFLLCIVTALTLSGCEIKANRQTVPVSRSNYMLGTLVEITIYDKVDSKVFDKAFDRIREIETKMTINNASTSEIIKLNEASGKEAVKLSPDTFAVAERGKYYSELSGGRFDLTIGPPVKLWNIGTDYAAVPDADALKKAIKLVSYKKLLLDKTSLTAKLADTGMKVDLGAIAKGYSADEAARVLRENGVNHAIINLGGNILAMDKNPNGNPWKIGIQDPISPRGDYMGIVSISNQTVVTSGTYERYFVQNGKRYHHILDPATGYPVENELCSVSIITTKSIDGDGLSTTTMLLGLEKGMKLIESLKDVEAIFVTNDKKVYISSGLKGNFKLSKSDYKLMK